MSYTSMLLLFPFLLLTKFNLFGFLYPKCGVQRVYLITIRQPTLLGAARGLVIGMNTSSLRIFYTFMLLFLYPMISGYVCWFCIKCISILSFINKNTVIFQS